MGGLAVPSRPTLSALYIVKNEEEFLPFSLRSVQDVADEIIIVDNQSTDGTVEIARRFPGVKIIFADIQDNYSALRNLGLQQARGEWLMPMMDADCIFYNDIKQVVPRLIQSPLADAYLFWYYHLLGGYFQVQNKSDHDPTYQRIMLARNRPGMHWVGAVHEHLEGIGPHVLDSGLHYVHYGYVKPQRHIWERWVKYARLEGRPGVFDHLDPDHILDGCPVRPFDREHPEVIRDYVWHKTGRYR